MSSPFHVRYLSIPAAAALVVALAVGCSSEASTALDQDQLELAAKKGKVHGYAFFVVGEGIEKKSTDFAAEVMAQAGKAH